MSQPGSLGLLRKVSVSSSCLQGKRVLQQQPLTRLTCLRGSCVPGVLLISACADTSGAGLAQHSLTTISGVQQHLKSGLAALTDSLSDARHRGWATPAIVAVQRRMSPQVLARMLRGVRVSGPASVILVLCTLVGAMLAALRQRIVSSVRSCTCCRGYGIQRCSLCDGVGTVGWEGKWSHTEACPMCLGRRYRECNTCGGKYHRPMFLHCHRPAYRGEDPPAPLRQVTPQTA